MTIMRISILLPEYVGCGIDIFWEKNSVAIIEADSRCVTIKGTKEAFASFAKQMLYFCFNTMPSGTHVHYDPFFCKSNLIGLGLLIELKEDERETDMYGFDDVSNLQDLYIPDTPFDDLWFSDADINVTYDVDEVRICGNRVALFAVAKKMLSLCCTYSEEGVVVQYSYPIKLDGWHGAGVCFQILE
jgi:hypothetical protein